MVVPYKFHNFPLRGASYFFSHYAVFLSGYYSDKWVRIYDEKDMVYHSTINTRFISFESSSNSKYLHGTEYEYRDNTRVEGPSVERVVEYKLTENGLKLAFAGPWLKIIKKN
jgi:hypothetical protein